MLISDVAALTLTPVPPKPQRRMLCLSSNPKNKVPGQSPNLSRSVVAGGIVGQSPAVSRSVERPPLIVAQQASLDDQSSDQSGDMQSGEPRAKKQLFDFDATISIDVLKGILASLNGKGALG